MLCEPFQTMGCIYSSVSGPISHDIREQGFAVHVLTEEIPVIVYKMFHSPSYTLFDHGNVISVCIYCGVPGPPCLSVS